MVEFCVPVPGALTLIDHSIFRTDKGAVGFLKAGAWAGACVGRMGRGVCCCHPPEGTGKVCA